MLDTPFNETSREDFEDEDVEDCQLEDEKDFDNYTSTSSKQQAMVRKPYLFYPD